MRLKLERILVITELPPWGNKAVPYALQLVRDHGADVHFVHVVSAGFFEKLGTMPMTEGFRKSWREVLFSKSARQFVVDSKEVRSKLSAVLCRYDYDLVLVSAAPADAADPLSVPIREALRSADCPVMVFGPMVPDSYALNPEPITILYATDFSPSAVRAAQYASAWAQEFQSWLRVLHVVEGVRAWTEHERRRLEEPFRKWMGELMPDELKLWCELEKQVDFGTPSHIIARTAIDCHADLLVIGLSGLDGVANAPGATAKEVIAHAPCPVLVVREDIGRPLSLGSGGERVAHLEEELVA